MIKWNLSKQKKRWKSKQNKKSKIYPYILSGNFTMNIFQETFYSNFLIFIRCSTLFSLFFLKILQINLTIMIFYNRRWKMWCIYLKVRLNSEWCLLKADQGIINWKKFVSNKDDSAEMRCNNNPPVGTGQFSRRLRRNRMQQK